MLRCRALSPTLRTWRFARYATAASVSASASVHQLLSEGKPYEAAKRILDMQAPVDTATAVSPSFLQAQLLRQLGTDVKVKDLDLALEVFDKVLSLSRGVDKFSCARLSLLCINAGYPNKALEPWARLLEVLGSKVQRSALDKILDKPDFEPAAVAALAAYFLVAGDAAEAATAHKLVPRKHLPATLHSVKNLGGITSSTDREVVLRGLARLQRFVSDNFTSATYLERVEAASFAEVGHLWKQVLLATDAQGIAEATYAAFIRRFSETRQTDKAFETWQTMVDSGVVITTLGWAALLKAALHTPENSHAIFLNLWDRMVASGYKPDAQCWLQRLLLLTRRGGNTDQALSEFTALQKTPELVDIKCVNVMVAAYGRQRKFAEADALVQWAKTHGMQPTSHTYNVLIQSSIGRPETSTRYLSEMSEQGVSPDIVTYTFVAEQMLRRGQSIGELLAEMHERRIEPNEQFTAVVAYGLGHNTKNLEVSRQTMATMLEKKLPASLPTLGAFIELELSYGDVDRAVKYVALIDKFGLTPNVPTYNQLIRGALARGRLDAAATAFEKLASGAHRRLTPNTYTYTFLLKPWSTVDLQARADVRSLVRKTLVALAQHTQVLDYHLAQRVKRIASATNAELVPNDLLRIADERSVELFDKRRVAK